MFSPPDILQIAVVIRGVLFLLSLLVFRQAFSSSQCVKFSAIFSSTKKAHPSLQGFSFLLRLILQQEIF